LTLITSISGIRGILGGIPGEGLTPDDIVKFTASFAAFLQEKSSSNKIVIGRDARTSGEMVKYLVSGTLMAMGFNVVDLGLSTTPTVEMAVVAENAAGGIIITASHNPGQWNALKLLNGKGEFISDEEGQEILQNASEQKYIYKKAEKIGNYSSNDTYLDWHIERIISLPLVDIKAIKEAEFHIAVDAVNSTGGFAVPKLLKALGVKKIIEINCTPDGKFQHNPEPLPENLTTLSQEVKFNKADLGISVDPDVDRLALVCEDGSFFGEEYTLVAVSDYILQNKKGATVSNLSSTRALKDVTENYGCQHYSSAVGEVNVVKVMKEKNAVIGGEGNGGIIYPDLHYGRDALVGIALFLTYLSKSGKSCTQLLNSYPQYYISKNKYTLEKGVDTVKLLEKIRDKYKHLPVNTIDGVKIDFENDWVHLRRSNTEPIIRIYTESESQTTAENLAKKLMNDIKTFMQDE
jgi:phosphomannomutase